MAIYSIYRRDYLAGHLSISNIPYKFWDEDIVKRALSVEPYIYYEELLEHSHNKLTGISVTKCVKLTPERYRSVNFYKRLLKLDEEKYRHLVPKEMLKRNIEAKVIKASDFIEQFKQLPQQERTPHMYNRLSKLSFDDYLLYVVNYKGIPEGNRTKEKCLPLFYANVEEYAMEIPDAYKTPELAKLLLTRDFNKWFGLLPSHCKTTWMYERFVEINPLINLPQVPRSLRTQKMYDIFFDYTLDTHLDMIPKEFLSDAMWKKLVILDPKKYFYNAPETCIDHELAVILIKKSPYYIDDIPEIVLTKDVFLDLIHDNFRKYLEYLPERYYTSDVINQIAAMLNKTGDLYLWQLNANPRLNQLIIECNPLLINRFTENVFRDIMKIELLRMVEEGGDIERIALKYRINPMTIYNAFKGLSTSDPKVFAKISSYLTGGHTISYSEQIKADLHKLEEIIQALGPATRATITTEQKVTFAYLTNRHLHFSLEKIFNFNNSSLNPKASTIVNHFFECILNHSVKANSYNGAFDMRKIKNNNEWLKGFNVKDFFRLSNGKQHSWYYYKNYDNEMTDEMANKIIERLKFEEIPTNYLIVLVAFRKYFEGELDSYIKELHGYDQIFEEKKKTKKR